MRKEIRQEVDIKVKDKEKVFKELISWGEAAWWPQNSLMHFINLSGYKGERTVYLQKVGVFLGPSWHSRNEVVDKDKGYIKRLFLDGMFAGSEKIGLIKEVNLYKVIYVFDAQVKGFLNQFLWRVFFRRLHLKNINSILLALKNYLEK